MSRRGWSFAVMLACALLAGAVALGQMRGGGRSAGQRPRTFDPDAIDRGNVPNWELDAEFKDDCFTFVRLKYTSQSYERSSRAWWTDYPDADLNISWRLHQLTSMKVDPKGKVIEITDPALFDYPFAFMSGVPALEFTEEEVPLLRRYLRNGGFLMVDDFWGEDNFEHFWEQIRRVLPEAAWEELPLEHPIFNCVFRLKERPQIPNVGFAVRNRGTGRTWEVEDGRDPHYRAIRDEKGRIMVLICHNTDLGDGWEEEATDPYYFQEFSEKKAYPLGINIIYYVMTH